MRLHKRPTSFSGDDSNKINLSFTAKKEVPTGREKTVGEPVQISITAEQGVFTSEAITVQEITTYSIGGLISIDLSIPVEVSGFHTNEESEETISYPNGGPFNFDLSIPTHVYELSTIEEEKFDPEEPIEDGQSTSYEEFVISGPVALSTVTTSESKEACAVPIDTSKLKCFKPSDGIVMVPPTFKNVTKYSYDTLGSGIFPNGMNSVPTTWKVVGSARTFVQHDFSLNSVSSSRQSIGGIVTMLAPTSLTRRELPMRALVRSSPFSEVVGNLLENFSHGILTCASIQNFRQKSTAIREIRVSTNNSGRAYIMDTPSSMWKFVEGTSNPIPQKRFLNSSTPKA